MSYKSKIIKRSKSYKNRQKIKGLILFKKYPRKSQEVLSNKIGYSKSAYQVWLRIYREEGIEKLLEIKAKGRPKSHINKEMHKGLEEKLKSSINPLLGYKDAIIWVKQKYGKDIKYNTLRMYIKRNFKAKLKVPRKSHYKKDEKLVEAFKKNAKILVRT